MEYIAPEKGRKTFTCPHCHTLSSIEYQEGLFDRDKRYTPTGNYAGYNTKVYIGRCLSCGKKIIWIDDEYIYPDIQQQEPNSDMPNSVLQLYKEAGLIYNKSPRAACALLRLAVDRLCNELGENDAKIDNNIAALVKRGLSVEIQQALDVVRVVGNKAVHPGQIEFDVDNIETVQMLFGLINMIVERLISEPKRLNTYYNMLPQNSRDAIKRRDNNVE